MAERTFDSVEELRAKIDGETRFKRVMRGYDPDDVNTYIASLRKDMRRMTDEQGAVAKNAASLEAAVASRDEEIARLKRQESENAARVTRAMQTITQLKAELEAARTAAGETEPLHREIGDLAAQLSVARGEIEQSRAAAERAAAESREMRERASEAETALKANKLEMIECLHMLAGIQGHTASVLGGKLEEITRLIAGLQEEAASTAETLRRKMKL